jgi:L-asparaginase
MTKTIPAPIQLIYAGGTFGSYGRPLAPLSAEVFLPTLQQLLVEPDNALNISPIAWLIIL